MQRNSLNYMEPGTSDNGIPYQVGNTLVIYDYSSGATSCYSSCAMSQGPLERAKRSSSELAGTP
jgi:hypothetical protein